jgi:predicted dehydrogenase
MSARKPRLGFIGVGWIGLNRMKAMLAAADVEASLIVEPADAAAAAALALAPGARRGVSFEAALAADLDGLVIATPSALHAAQAQAGLERGLAVFCQKPLGRSEVETRAVVDAARAANVLLAVDLSYRWTSGMQRIRELIRAGEFGRVFAADLTFHNAYGPDKPWFYDPVQSGGGCVMDLGVHLVDLALWALDFPEVGHVASQLFAAGARIEPNANVAEDYAVAQIDLKGGASLRLACSWRLQAGREALIEATFYGERGGASLRNVEGSFYDFAADRFYGVRRETLAIPGEDWGAGAAADWARRVARGERNFDPEAESLVRVAAALDAIYRRG